MSDFQDLINREIPVLVDFFATWCGPCKALAPILSEVKAEFGDELSIIKIDVDKNAALASQFMVQGVPTMILFRKGKQVWRQSGVLSSNAIATVIRSNS